MRILLASSEVFPYSKTGGLADAVGALGKALAKAGHRVGIVTPLYRGIREKFADIKRADWHFDLPVGVKRVSGELWVHEPTENLTVYFINEPQYFDRPGIYNEAGADYVDNAERFIYFSKCVTHLTRYLPWQPEVVNSNDWQTGLVPLLIRHQERAEGWVNAPKGCHTIHNLAYQGIFPTSAYALTNLPPDYFHPNGTEFYGMLNCLKAGIVYAGMVTTVSPRYAREITTEEFGEALDDQLRKRQGQGRLVGILNGVDYEEWNTAKNPHLPAPYSLARMAGKSVDKAALQAEMELPVDASTPLFGTITRLADQKGVPILLGALEEMLAAKMQFVLLGSGDAAQETAFKMLQARFPKKVSARIGYSHALSHRIEAGCDFYLMPSRFEPCGLNQMYSLRYGTIPIVRRTGGLDDAVTDATDAIAANGIKFANYAASALAKGIRKAFAIYGEPKVLRAYQRNAIRADFSWERRVPEYVAAFQKS